MSFMLKAHWVVWTVLVLTVLAGATIDELSSANSIAIKLNPKTKIDVTVFRPLPHVLRLSLDFKRSGWADKRPELGEYRTSAGSRGYLEFSNPGGVVKLLASNGQDKVVYEALPVTGANQNTMTREMVPFVDDGNPKRYKWPPSKALEIPTGFSKISISVLEVAPRLVDEQATLIVIPPVGFKATAYGFLWWFIFWPLYAFILTGYGAVLIWQTKMAPKLK